MLVGTIKYTAGGREFPYIVEGVDNSESLRLYMVGKTYDAQICMSSPDLKDDPYYERERRVDINLTKIVVQTRKSLGANGKMVKAPVNGDLFCRLGALIRYVKINCTASREQGYTGLAFASSDFDIQSSRKYVIPYPEDSGVVLATVTLNLGNIRDLLLKTDDFEIELYEEGDDKLFPAIKDGWTSGFRLNSEYLGFPIGVQKIEKVRHSDGLYHTLDEVMAAHPEKELAWLREKDYRVVTDETLEEVCRYIMDYDGLVYYDTETTGLRINFLSRTGLGDQLVGVILSVKYGESFYFPLQMKQIKNLCGGDHYYVMEHYLKPILEGKDLVAQNMSFDWKVGYIYNINAHIVHDIMALLSLTFASEIKNFSVGLKEATKVLLGRDSLELSDLVIDNSWGENDIKFWDLSEELTTLYACPDTDNLNGLLGYCLQNDILGKYNAKKVYEIEIAFSYAVAYQEFYGHRIDTNNIDHIRESIGEGLKKEKEILVGIAGHDFNPNSSKQLIKIMYEELGIPEMKSRKTGNLTTDKDTLEKLAEITNEDDEVMYPFALHMQKYREYEGVRKIVDKFPEHMFEGGYIFSEVQQYGTTTGRVSTKHPNYQSYNDVIKKNVVPRPGFWMWDTDYSSVEYRVLANMVGNERIKKSFEDPDFDYHAYQAAHMYRIKYSAVTKKLRKAAKGINFGLPYGMGDESLGVRIFGEATPENTRKAAALRAAYFRGQEDIRDWFEYHRDKGVNLGYTETYFGRRRYYRKSDFTEGAIRRQAGNHVIQGCINFETRIQTKEYGIVKVGTIVGNTLHVWDGWDWTTGTVVYSGKKQRCIVHFKGGQMFECSPDHKFMVRSHRGKDRFVRCADLVGLDKTRNAHRVVVNPNYAVSDFIYSSEEYYGFASNVGNANNVFIDTMQCDSFKRGIVLGRLASDGSYANEKNDRVLQLVAEHEENIVSCLSDYMSDLGVSVLREGLRDGRNEVMTRIQVYSKSLVRELQELDVKHKLHDNIFMDTELLRGFLCGFFDGDGGISGKAIMLVFGIQYDFEPMCLDMQKALLFFGIRSRYRKYPDRYVLQIRTGDNERFLDLIGFLNTKKQEKGRKLECVEDEHIFGKCLLVDYVEFTDEYVDMYDVCNTERGYYVADGVVTHNSAADLYKMAVGNVFKRICKEGWLGKVLFDGFIHDELLGECSNDINPGVFLRVLREEFELKVENDDGSEWCPLYMGFGFGMNWYEAKSVELPIKLQWELVEKYGVDGFPDWYGKGREFFDKIPDMLRDFEVRDIRNQLLDPDSQGKEIKPTLNNQVLDICKEDAKVYPKAIEEYNGDMGYLNSVYHFQGVLRDDDNNILNSFEPAKTTQDAITQYCLLHGVDRSKVNIFDIDENEGGSASVFDTGRGMEDAALEEELQALKNNRLEMLGMYVNSDAFEVTCLWLDSEFMKLIFQHMNKEGKGMPVFFRISDATGVHTKKSLLYMETKAITEVQTLYQIHLTNMRGY